MEQLENAMVNQEKPVRIAERFKFFKRDQLEEETITIYLMELKILATTCEFSAYLEEALCDKFVCGIQDENIQADLLTKHDLTLDDAYHYALSMEVTRYADESKPFLTNYKEEDELSNFENCHSSFDIKEELQPCELQEEFQVQQEFVDFQSETNLQLQTDCDEQLLLLNIHNGKKKFLCEYCQSAFSSNSHLTRHERSHTGEKPFVCITCDKGFSRGEILRQHTQKSSACADYDKQKPILKKNVKADKEKVQHICATCGRLFLKKSHLQRHLKIHTGEKPYTCAICKNTFARKESLRKHLKIHGFGVHSIKKSAKKCKICGLTFLKKMDLDQHFKSHTGLAATMPNRNKYVRKTTRQSWSEGSMRAAITVVIEGKMGYLKASQIFGIPKSTLENRVKKARIVNSVDEASQKGLGRYKPVFTAAQEGEFASYILETESRLFGLTSLSDLRRMAFEFADRNKLEHGFNRENKMAGKAWLYGFLERHKNLRLKSPEATSVGFTRSAVNKFFSLLTEVCEKYKFTPECIWNVDETVIMTVLKKQSQMIGLRGKRKVGALVSAERGTLVTAEICMNAAGGYMPNMLIFPRKRAKLELLDDAPPGTTAEFHPSGLIQKDLFIKWFHRFLATANPSAQKPVLLLLDGQAIHTKSIELINLARENNVTLLGFPPKCTHRMQPLDVSFMTSLGTYYEEEARKWLCDEPGRCITINQVGKLFGIAFMKAANVQAAVNGFRKTGIYPLNPEVFEDWKFAPLETTEISC